MIEIAISVFNRLFLSSMLIRTPGICLVTTRCSSVCSLQTSSERLAIERAKAFMEPKLKENLEGDASSSSSPSDLAVAKSILVHSLQSMSPLLPSSVEAWSGLERSVTNSPSELQISTLQRHRKGLGAGPECLLVPQDESILDIKQGGANPMDVLLKVREKGSDGHVLGNNHDEEVPLDHISAACEEPSSSRVKLMCSFGGKILPRPSDGRLRYVGGETRIVAVNRDILYQELMLKMKELYGLSLTLKYQLPGEDLDALVSVSSDEDLENMMEEYDRLEAGDGMSRLRIFLFSAAEREAALVDDSSGDIRNSERRYVDAVNGVVENVREHFESGIPGGSAQGVEDIFGLDVANAFRVEDSLPASLQSVSNPSSVPQTGPSSPSFLPMPSQMKQTPSVLDLSSHYSHDHIPKAGVHSYPNFLSDLKYQELDFASSPPMPNANMPEYFYESRRNADLFAPVQRELHPSAFHHDNFLRNDQQHLSESLIPRVGSQGKFLRAQEHPMELPSNIWVDKRTDLQQLPDKKEYQRLILQQQHQQATAPHHAPGNHADSLFRSEQRRVSDSSMPRVNSYVKISHMLEQHVDPRLSSALPDNRAETHHFPEGLSSHMDQQKLFFQQQSQMQQQPGIFQEKVIREQRHAQDQHLDNTPSVLVDNRLDVQQLPEKQHIEMQRFVLQAQQHQLQQPLTIYQESSLRTEQRQLGEVALPHIASSHGKLSRLPEQHLDPQPSVIIGEGRRTSQQMPEILPQGELQRAAMHHQLLPWEIDSQHDNHRRPERLQPSFTDHTYSHQQSTQQHSLLHHLHYHSYQAAMHEAYNRQSDQPHHLDDPFTSYQAAAAHDILSRQSEQPHLQDEAFSGHLIHRSISSQAITNHASHVMASASTYHTGSDPSSPRLSFREMIHRQPAPVLHNHRPHSGPLHVDQQYGRRPNVYDPLNRAFRLSKSPPRYRELEDRTMWQHQQLSTGNLESSLPGQGLNAQFPFDGASASQIKYVEVLARPGMPHFIGSGEEGLVSYQDNGDAMEMRRQIAQGKDPSKFLPGGQPQYQFTPTNMRREYVDHLPSNQEQISIHDQYHERQERGADGSSVHRASERDDSRLRMAEHAWKGLVECHEHDLKLDMGVNLQTDSLEVRHQPLLPEGSGSTYPAEDLLPTMENFGGLSDGSTSLAVRSNSVLQEPLNMSGHSVGTGISIISESFQTSPVFAQISNQSEPILSSTVHRPGEIMQEVKTTLNYSEQNYCQHAIAITGPLTAEAGSSNETSELVDVGQSLSKSSCVVPIVGVVKNTMDLEAYKQKTPSNAGVDRIKVAVTGQSQCCLQDSDGSSMQNLPVLRMKDDGCRLSSNISLSLLPDYGHTSGTLVALQAPLDSQAGILTWPDAIVSSSPCATLNMKQGEPPLGIALQCKSTNVTFQGAASSPSGELSVSESLKCEEQLLATLDAGERPVRKHFMNDQNRGDQLASHASVSVCIDLMDAVRDCGHSMALISATRDNADELASLTSGSQVVGGMPLIGGSPDRDICGKESAIEAASVDVVMKPDLSQHRQGAMPLLVDFNELPLEEAGKQSKRIMGGRAGELSSVEVVAKNPERTPHDTNNKEEFKRSFGDAASAEAEAIARGLQTIKNADLEEIKELGSGTFGTVYYGKWRGSDVAIKRIKASCFAGRPAERERLIADFWKEACTLSHLHHPNVVAFYGVVPDGPGGTLATVTEYMVNGSLKQVLQKKDRTIDRRKRLLIAMDAAFGMEYLHGKNIVHFDLKCENLLVNMRDPHRPVCKVGDLGLSKVKHQTMVSGGVRGTLPWMAPELLNGNSSMVTEKVDVFSFGIVMWELLTGEEPYANMHYGAIIGGIVSNTLRPPIPNWCDPGWRSLMERCWAADHANRPSFSQIANELRAMTAPVQPKT